MVTKTDGQPRKSDETATQLSSGLQKIVDDFEAELKSNIDGPLQLLLKK